MNLDILKQPITPQEIEWRVQSQTKDGQKLMILAYITSRCAMERLDAAFGVLGWKSEFKEVTDGFLCTLSVRNDNGEWICKTDGAQRTDVEGLKGGVSGSLKRTAVQLGLGRSLYDFPKVMIQTTDKFIPSWALPLLDKLVEKINGGGQVRDVIVLKEEHSRPASNATRTA